MQNSTPNTKEKILESARKKFSSAGYEATTMTAIAEVVGIKKSSLYYFFDSKADLFLRVVREVLLEQQEIFSLDNLGPDNSKNLTDVIEKSIVSGLKFGQIIHVPEAAGKNASGETCAEIEQEAEKTLAVIAEFCRRCGVAEPSHATHVIIDTSRGYIVRSQAEEGTQTPKAHARQMARLLLSER